MTPLHHLQTLGLKPGVTKDTVKKAWRDQVKIHHPDRGGDETRMKAINLAWDFLKDLSDFSESALYSAQQKQQSQQKRPSQPYSPSKGFPVYSAAFISKLSGKHFLSCLSGVMLDQTNTWIEKVSKANKLSLLLHLSGLWLPSEKVYIHTLHSIMVGPKNLIIYRMETQIQKGVNIFVLPRCLNKIDGLYYKGHCFPIIHTTGHDYTNISSLTVKHPAYDNAKIEFGFSTPRVYTPHNPGEFFSNDSSIVKKVNTLNKRLKGKVLPGWKLIAHPLRFLLSPFFK